VNGSVERVAVLLVGEDDVLDGLLLALDGEDEVVRGLEVSREGPVPLAGVGVVVEVLGAGLGGVL
jgi:hypothetical protein